MIFKLIKYGLISFRVVQLLDQYSELLVRQVVEKEFDFVSL